MSLYGVNHYPEQPNAPIHVMVSITTKTRSTERWKMTTTNTEPFNLYSTLLLSSDVLRDFLVPVWNFAERQRALTDTTDISLRYNIQIDNTTAPEPSVGSLVQKKMHFGGELTDEEYDSSATLQAVIEQTLASLKKLAKY